MLCRTVTLSALPRWRPGPVPFCQPSTPDSRDRGMHATTDTHARTTLVSPDLGPVLYDDEVRRWLPVQATIAGRPVVALELCLVGDGELAVLSVHLTGKAEAALATRLATDEAVEFWTTLGEQYLENARYADGPVRTVSFAPATASGALQTAYSAVTGSGPEAARRAARHTLTIEKPDWSAIVLRDGLALVSHPAEDRSFAPHLQVQAHSVYLDALLLAWIQRVRLDQSGGRAVNARLDVPDELVELERSHYDFKRTAWRRSLTQKRTSPIDDVLVALQRELLTDRDVEDVEERVQDGARLARTLQQEKTARAQDSLNRTVESAAVIIGALGLAYSAAPTIAEPSMLLFLWATAAGLGAMSVALLLLAWIHRR